MNKMISSQRKHHTLRSYFLVLLVFLSSLAFAQTITVNSPAELLPYLDKDDVDVKLTPGTYTISAADIENGTFGTPRFVFAGNNSTYDFTGVTILFAADVYLNGHSMSHVQTLGNGNTLKNLRLVDMCNKDENVTGKEGGTGVVMDGADNVIEGFHQTVKGSYPYGYGDSFGKGATWTIRHWKHCGFLIRGDRNSAINDTIIHRAYGHAMFLQGAYDAIIDGCYIEGEVRSTDDMLAEEGTGSPADLINFHTVFGYRLPPGYVKTTAEAGIRAYNTGTTTIDGETVKRGTHNVTIKNCFVKNTRTGVVLSHASGTKYVENVTAIGVEQGFAIATGTIRNCYTDVQFGPALAVAYTSDKGTDADITIVPYEEANCYHLYTDDISKEESYNGLNHVAYIIGSNHNITFKSTVDTPDQDLYIALGGDKTGIGNLAEDQNNLCNNITFNNYTNYPIILDDNTSGNNGVSGGMVTDFGSNNSFTSIASSARLIQAEDYYNPSGVTIVDTNDEGEGQHVTSIDINDWMLYEVEVPYSGTYFMDYRVASSSAGDFTLSVNDLDIEQVVFDATGGTDQWSTIRSNNSFYLQKGTHTFKLLANSSGFNINWMDLLLDCAEIEIKPIATILSPEGLNLGIQNSNALTIIPGSVIHFSPEPSLGGTWSWEGPNGFTSSDREIELLDIQEEAIYTCTYTNECGLESQLEFSISLNNGLKVQAEDYNNQEGVGIESTADTDGGSNVYNISTDNWMEYIVDVPYSAMYTIDYRVASENNNGNFDLSLNDNIIDQINFNATGGAQVWSTVSSDQAIYLEKGTHTLLLSSKSDDWKLNWIDFRVNKLVRECNLPYQIGSFSITSQTQNWSSGLIDISCVPNANVYIKLSEIGTVIPEDYIQFYYSIDGGEPVMFMENQGSLKESFGKITELNGTTLEIFAEGTLLNDDSFYTIEEIIVLETKDPFARIEAEDFDSVADAVRTSVGDDLTNLSSVNQGDWAFYSNLDLTGATSFFASVSTVNSDVYFEVRLGSVDGTLLGTVQVPNTGSWTSYEIVNTYLDEVSGIHDVYLVFQTETSTNACNIDWFQFSNDFVKRPTDPFARIEAEINDGESGTEITSTTDEDGDEELSNLQDGDYIYYTELNIEKADSIDVRIACAIDNAVIEIRVGGYNGDILDFIDVPNTGGLDSWQTIGTTISNLVGDNDLYFVFKGEGDDIFRLNWMQFKIYQSPFAILESENYNAIEGNFTLGTSDDEEDENGEILKYLEPNSWIKFEGVNLEGANSISTRYTAPYAGAYVEVRLDTFDGEQIGTIDLNRTAGWSTWSTAAANINATIGEHDLFFVFKTESSLYVGNNNWFQLSELQLPAQRAAGQRIEVEGFDRASGTQTLLTTDIDGDQELGAIEYGNWILFKDVDLTNMSHINVRVANPNAGGLIELRYGAYNRSLLGNVVVPSTGSSTAWETFNARLYGAEGKQDVYLIFKGSNIDQMRVNWIQFTDVATSNIESSFSNKILLYPNPVTDFITVENAKDAQLEIYNVNGQIVFQQNLMGNKERIKLNELIPGFYMAKIKSNDIIESFKVLKK